MITLTIALAVAGILSFAKALLIARGVRILRLNNESINFWLSATATISALTFLTIDGPNIMTLFPSVNLLLLFAFYLQPTFRVSKYIAYIFIPVNIVFLSLQLIK